MKNKVQYKVNFYIEGNELPLISEITNVIPELNTIMEHDHQDYYVTKVNIAKDMFERDVILRVIDVLDI